jgi:polyisoprenyl-teichoic acid--peptidoglycan teichoic acid transferase
MIFANINPETRKITLISLPRDLYYNGRKINSIYSLYGIEELKRTITFITGYKIDKHILIDMYAFIDVIDMIGGVDVHLSQPVIDPTYKTYDGGKWGTLYYRAGDHHLSGKQALRLARTRHTSSDFARAERQQMIIAAIQKKARTFGLGDATGLKSLAEKVLEKTETDINIVDAITYYFRYQNFEISKGHVISSGNVLYSKYTGELKKEESACPSAEKLANLDKDIPQNMAIIKKCEEIEKGAYILLPRNDNWNTVKWYFRGIIEAP